MSLKRIAENNRKTLVAINLSNYYFVFSLIPLLNVNLYYTVVLNNVAFT